MGLYLAYLDVMTRNASLFRGEEDPRTPDIDDLYVGDCPEFG